MTPPSNQNKTMTNLINTAVELAANTWDSLLGRVALAAVVVGWVPFYFLSLAHAALKS